MKSLSLNPFNKDIPMPLPLFFTVVLAAEAATTATTAATTAAVAAGGGGGGGFFFGGGLIALAQMISILYKNNNENDQEAFNIEQGAFRAAAAHAAAIQARTTQSVDIIIQETNETQVRLNTEIERLETQNAAMQTEITHLNNEVTTFRQTNQSAEAMITSLTTELTALREHSAPIYEQLTSATTSLQFSEEALSETTRQLNHLRETLETSEAHYQSEITNLRSALERRGQTPDQADIIQRLQQRIRSISAQYQEAVRAMMNTQNLEGETLHDNQRNSTYRP
jgi:chromosome segregation ATPase